MMKMIRLFAGAALVATLAACGGGGGSAGTTTGGNNGGGGTGGTTTVATPTLVLDIVDSTGATTSTVSSTSNIFAKATATDGNGGALSGEVITFSTDNSLARFIPASGTALTGSNGVAMVQITPASTTSAGAGTLQATATLKGTGVSTSKSYTVPLGQSVDTQTAKVSNFVVLLDKTTLTNASTATAKLTVVAVDANNNIVPSAAVHVTTNSNTFFTPGSTTTDAQGIFTGTVSNAGDKTDRQVTVSTTINGKTINTQLQIAGSQIALTVTPSVPSPGAPATLTAHLTDSSSAAIAGTTLLLTSDIAALNNKSQATDANGNVIINFTAPSSAGSYQIAAAGSGVTTQQSLQVGSSVSIPVAVIPGGVAPSLTSLPNVIKANLSGSTTNQAQIKFVMIDSNNVPVPNVRVRFDITSTGLGSFDASMSTGTSTVYTNAAGVATANFIAGTTSSPTNGVIVRACYQATDFTSSTQCPNSVNTNLTVTGQALAVSIGDDNVLGVGVGGTYIKKFVVTVADASGGPVADAPVDISVDITHYGKGDFLQDTTFPLSINASNTYVPDATTSPSAYGSRVSCVNEDANRNGIVDPGENINGSIDSSGQPTLDPRKSDIIISYVAGNKTDARGVLVIQVEYSQRFATWLAYRIRASTSVSGSQGNAERSFVTDFALGDAPNGSFRTPPYGTGACNNPN
ncbi:MAG TPA: Ig-like domain-containing protein [Ramlibacter sp.]|nr:Ig-like domain-containing protein [Ramlibacter sp.]